MQKNNRLLGILKIESANVHFHANPYISPNAHRERICIFTEVLEVPRSTDPQFSHTRLSVLLSNEVGAEEKKIKWNV